MTGENLIEGEKKCRAKMKIGQLVNFPLRKMIVLIAEVVIFVMNKGRITTVGWKSSVLIVGENGLNH